MFSFVFRKTSPWDYQRRRIPPLPTDTVTFHAGTDYAACGQPFHSMWALITVSSIFLPTSQRNRCPHQSVFGAHIHWNQLPTWTGIRTSPFGGPVCCRLSDGELLRACIFHESVCSCHYYSELPQLIFLLLKNRSLLRRISYSLFKR